MINKMIHEEMMSVLEEVKALSEEMAEDVVRMHEKPEMKDLMDGGQHAPKFGVRVVALRMRVMLLKQLQEGL